MHTQSYRPSISDLKQNAKKAANLGGLSATVPDDYQQELKELAARQEEPLLGANQQLRDSAEEDLVETIKYLKKSSRRRAATEWSVPSEIFL